MASRAHRWNAPRRAAVLAFVETAVVRLRLADWTVTVDFDRPSPPDSVASMDTPAGQKRATMRLGKDFLSCSAADQRQTLVHELIHCHLFDVQHTAHQMVGYIGGDKAEEIAVAAITMRVEWATDALADAFAAMVEDLPVPASL